MIHRLALCLAIVSLAFVAPPRAAAAITTVFDTVDAVEFAREYVGGNHDQQVTVTGIVVGATVQTTQVFSFGSNPDLPARCERFAAIAMSKPGKYRFGIGPGNFGGCKLILRTP